MPTYDYKCLECNYAFEEFQKMTDEPLQNCPKCNGQVKRLIGSGAGPIFKGSGFYQTDYKGTTKTETPKSTEKKETSKSTATSETKSEKKA